MNLNRSWKTCLLVSMVAVAFTVMFLLPGLALAGGGGYDDSVWCSAKLDGVDWFGVVMAFAIGPVVSLVVWALVLRSNLDSDARRPLAVVVTVVAVLLHLLAANYGWRWALAAGDGKDYSAWFSCGYFLEAIWWGLCAAIVTNGVAYGFGVLLGLFDLPDLN